MLTDEDRTALMQAAHRADVTGCACLPVWDVAAAIVARHVNAALTEVARRIEQTPAEQWGVPLVVGATEPEQRGYFHGANAAISFAASIVRAAINPKETR